MSRTNHEFPATTKALTAVASGMSITEAAKKYKVARTTIYRAIQRKKERVK